MSYRQKITFLLKSDLPYCYYLVIFIGIGVIGFSAYYFLQKRLKDRGKKQPAECKITPFCNLKNIEDFEKCKKVHVSFWKRWRFNMDWKKFLKNLNSVLIVIISIILFVGVIIIVDSVLTYMQLKSKELGTLITCIAAVMQALFAGILLLSFIDRQESLINKQI